VKADVFVAVGTMDEAFFLYFDDADFVHRCRLAGFDIWLDSHLWIEHKVSSLSGGSTSPLGLYWMSRNWLLMIRKHARPAQKVWSFAYVALWTSARFALGRESPRDFRTRLRGYRDGIRSRKRSAPVAGRFASGASPVPQSRDSA
jgi:GT2 family glycosyltransferase